MTTTATLRTAIAHQGSHWLARCLLLTRMDLQAGFSAGKARVAAVIRAELARRGIASK
jgi:hypothetical protein